MHRLGASAATGRWWHNLPDTIGSLERAVPAAVQHQLVRPAARPVQCALGHHRIGEQRIPILGRPIAGQGFIDPARDRSSINSYSIVSC